MRVISINIRNHVLNSLHGHSARLRVHHLAVGAYQVLIGAYLLVGLRLLLELKGVVELVAGGC
jgi:hypothetical protein